MKTLKEIKKSAIDIEKSTEKDKFYELLISKLISLGATVDEEKIIEQYCICNGNYYDFISLVIIDSLGIKYAESFSITDNTSFTPYYTSTSIDINIPKINDVINKIFKDDAIYYIFESGKNYDKLIEQITSDQKKLLGIKELFPYVLYQE